MTNYIYLGLTSRAIFIIDPRDLQAISYLPRDRRGHALDHALQFQSLLGPGNRAVLLPLDWKKKVLGCANLARWMHYTLLFVWNNHRLSYEQRGLFLDRITYS